MFIYDGKHDKKAFPTDHTVAVVSAGKIANLAQDYMTVRQNGREDWSLFFCEAGRICFNDGELQAGQVWLYPPHVPQAYTVYRNDRTVYRYLHFTGSDVATLLSSLEIPLTTPITVGNGSLTNAFENIQQDVINDDALSKLRAEYRTLRLLSVLAKHRTRFSQSNMMKRVTDEMEHSFPVAYDAARYADMFKIGVSRFNHLFKECVGVSPYAYYIRLRMENACGLLEDTDLKIQDIANRCGYEDAMYFTQAFKKTVGMTPSSYRKAKRYEE